MKVLTFFHLCSHFTFILYFFPFVLVEFERRYGRETGLNFENYKEYLELIEENHENIMFLVTNPNIQDELLEAAQSDQLTQFIQDHKVPPFFNSQVCILF